MVLEIINTKKIGIILPAVHNKKKGIFYKNDLGGKQFWTESELLSYFLKKTGENARWII